MWKRREYRLVGSFLLLYHAFSTLSSKLLKRIGGDDGTRTRGLCRDSEIFTRN